MLSRLLLLPGRTTVMLPVGSLSDVVNGTAIGLLTTGECGVLIPSSLRRKCRGVMFRLEATMSASCLSLGDLALRYPTAADDGGAGLEDPRGGATRNASADSACCTVREDCPRATFSAGALFPLLLLLGALDWSGGGACRFC